MRQKALYAGSFDPITNGHMDIIKRSSSLYDEVVIGVIDNPSKNSLFTVDERKKMIKDATSGLSNIFVDDNSGLLADYVNKNGFNVVIRGLRASADFEYEIQMAQMNAKLYKENVETIFLMTDPKYSFLSSSMIKEVWSLGGEISSLVPSCVISKLQDKI